ncbi:MAG: hypothetical protein E7606_00530 [Ruminococcaceae bacterium]|nr:hypothetical protein [Oscillospiraceae bacterium]
MKVTQLSFYIYGEKRAVIPKEAILKEKNTEKRSLLKRWKQGARETVGEFFGEPSVEWRGRGRLAVSGAQKIGFFAEDRILVLLKEERLWVCGKGLMCLSFQNEVLVIGGRICAVSYEEDEA